MKPYVLNFLEIDKTKLSAVGGKGANLGELAGIDGIRVPEGFCITTDAYRKFTENNAQLKELLEKLVGVKSDEKDLISEISGSIRSVIENSSMPKEVENAIIEALSPFDRQQAFAVRSSATAEDLPGASFAGQQDTYLNIRGQEEILKHVIKCWASLFTDRAMIYRIQNGFDHRKVLLSVVIQKMVMSEVSGILFTSDPLTSDRKTMSIDAGFGLGEALVSGLVNPDTYKVQDGVIVSKRTGIQTLEVRAAEGGGTHEMKIEEGRQKNQALTETQILRLAGIGRKIEDHFRCPQDIEWCLAAGEFYIVQSRPITTLFPAPESRDNVKRVYMSVGHMQVMTDPILPLGISFFEFASLFPVDRAGGRIYVDITFDLTTPQGRRMVKQKVDNMDPLMASAVRKVMENNDYIKGLPKGKGNLLKGANLLPWIKEAFRMYRKNDPTILDEMIRLNENSLQKLEQSLRNLSGDEVFDFILEDKKELQARLFDATGFGAVLACQYVSGWINRNTEKWLGEKNITNSLSKSVEHNVTSEMGLAICGVADVVRKYPEVREYFAHADDESFFDGLLKLQGGAETEAVIRDFLQKYGMRCPAEIDITKPRFDEKPTQLIPVILSDVKLLNPGEHIVKFEQGKHEAKVKEDEIIRCLQKLPGGAKKAKKAKKRISVFRNFVGAREYPKYFWVSRFAIYKRALLKEAEKLAAAGVINNVNDVFYLYFDEFREAVRTGRADQTLIENRKNEYARYEKLTPPRIILSDGEVPSGEYNASSTPEDALIGVPVSPGVVEGRARVVSRLEDAHVETGDILVTPFTDPSWTPVFVTIAGLVTEVGGEMSHGAVITREYGLPAVVGVENATKLIKDGQRLRLNGTDGYVEILG
ncbi:rifamycin-inactivating phosphotransferase [Sinanaerobacter chloroacetimidivorans]|uniref:Rifampicin phosphotransferase n=1 Tax=Sinanaerobacter chloroacetimidivorans TaxID=2818044 RepID=A0A8J7W3V0_9FIRM|nr:rifamycin-inactivating phosphotransferase [Sinanaerobacter chloroacetimidivorans]MBR0600019.1 phosphoenolpyruvate synthase [Sinanaerobacter chloroacetimidivorans]